MPGKKIKLMRKKSNLIVILALFGWGCGFFYGPWSAQAYFQTNVSGVRPAGMGESFVAVADDANTVLFNPAGFARIEDMQIVGMYSDLFSGANARLYTGQYDRLGYHFISLAVPVLHTHSAFGLAWTQFNSTFYKENAFTLSYARRIWPAYGLDLGINLKVLQWMVEANEYSTGQSFAAFPSRGKLAYTADMGVIATLFQGFNLGLSWDNLVPADVGILGTSYVPGVLRLGAAYQIPWQNEFTDSLMTSVEWTARDNIYNMKVGLEAWFLQRILALRTGLNMDSVTSGLSFRYAWSGRPLALQFDYAFAYPFQIFDTWGSHRVGITVNWGHRQPPPDEKILAADEGPAPERIVKHEPVVPQPQEGDEQPPYQISERERRLQELLAEIKDYHPKPLLFELGKGILLEANHPPLDFIGGLLNKYPDLKVRIEGHACNLGPEAFNMELSRQRAEAVQNYLIQKYGIKPEKFILEFYGESRPIAPNDSEQNREKNRRVDIYLVILALTM